MSSILGTAKVNTAGTNANNVTITLPTWTASTYTDIIAVLDVQSGSSTATVTTDMAAAGWTLDASGARTINSTMKVYRYYKSLTDSDSGTTQNIAWSASNRLTANVTVVEGVTYGGVVAVLATNAGATLTVPAGTSSSQPGILVAGWGGRSGNAGEQPTMDSTADGWSNEIYACTTYTATQRNSLWLQSSKSFSSTTVAAAVATASLSLNCRGGAVTYLLDVASGGATVDATAAPETLGSTTASPAARSSRRRRRTSRSAPRPPRRSARPG